MRKLISVIIFSCLSLHAYALHLVSDTAAQALQKTQIVETVNLVQAGLQQAQNLLKVYNQLQDIYKVVGYYRDTFSSVSNIWEEIQNQWSFGGVSDFDEFMTASSDHLDRWGIQPAQSGILGNLVIQSKHYKEQAQMAAGELSNLPYNYSRDNVLRDLFTTTEINKSNTSGLFGLFSTDIFEVKEVEDSTFALTENGVMVKTATGELATPTASDKLAIVDKVTAKLESQFESYAKSQAQVDAQTKAMAKAIASDTKGAYSDDLMGVTQQTADLAALQVAGIADVTSAINQNTATNLKMNQLILEANKAKAAAEQAKGFKDLLNE